MEKKLYKRKIFATVSGNMLELYDYALFGVLSVFITNNYFNLDNNRIKVFFSMFLVALAHIVRPLGSLINIYIVRFVSDEIILYYSIYSMAVASLIISVTPNNHILGVCSAILIVFSRLVQGLSLSGEFPASILVLSKLPSNHSNVIIGLSFVSGVLGMILGNIIVLFLSNILGDEIFSSWGWRVPFFIGAIIGFISSNYRKLLNNKASNSKSSNRKGIKNDWHNIFVAFLLSGLSSSVFYMNFVYLPILLKHYNQITQSLISVIMILGLFIYAASFLIFNFILSKVSLIKYLLLNTISFLCIVHYCLINIQIGGVHTILSMVLLSISLSFFISPVPYLLGDLFKKENGYGIYISYNYGISIFGAVTIFTLSLRANDYRIVELHYVLTIILLVFTFFYNSFKDRNDSL